MKLHLFPNDKTNLFTAVEDDHVKINYQAHHGQLIVMPQAIHADWTEHHFDNLDEADFEMLASLGCQVVLLGTGNRLRFPPGRLMKPIAEAGIGLEVMDLRAACRTYNILAAEGRTVAAALLFDPASE